MKHESTLGVSDPLGATFRSGGANFSLFSRSALGVELLPVFHFDVQDCPPGRVNYWGYAPVSFFAPPPAYSSRQDRSDRSTSFATW